MVYGYIRFSTSSQDEIQQKFALEEYAKQRGLVIDSFEMDEGISGGVTYKRRKLYKLITAMKQGDVLITTEISRLGRSMSDLNKLVNDEFVPRKIRLIVAKMGLDLNCDKLTAVDQMVLYAFGFSAQLEKEMIVQRTQSAIDARKEMILRDGGFVSKAGNYCTRLGHKKGEKNPNAIQAMASKRIDDAASWRASSPLYMWVTIQLLKNRPRKDILEEAAALYQKDPVAYGTREGKPMGKSRLSLWATEILKKN